MAIAERYFPQQEAKGPVEWYKNFNKITRNLALGIAAGGAFIGAALVTTVALASAAFDQGQIWLIEKYQKWRNKGKKAA